MGSYLRLIDFVYHSTLGLRVIQKKKKTCANLKTGMTVTVLCFLFFCITRKPRVD